MRDSGGPRGGGAADVFVMTALRVEFDAVLDELGPRTTFRHDADGAQYAESVLDGLYGPVRVTAQLVGQGNESAGIHLDRAVAGLRPAVVLLVGVAGGRKDVALGDVVVADSVYGYDAGRDEEDRFLPRPRTWHSDWKLVQQAQSVAALESWRRRTDGLPTPEGTPVVHVGAIAAGAKLVAHDRSRTARLLAATASDSLAVEREGLGFLMAAHLNRTVDALVVRGISDLLSDKTGAHDVTWQPVAARNAAAFAFKVILRYEPAVRAAGFGPPGAHHPEPGRRTTRTPEPGRPSATAEAPGRPLPAAPAGHPRRPGHGATPESVPAPLPGPGPVPGSGDLQFRDLMELAELLLRVPALGAPSGWQLVFDAVPALGQSTPRHDSVRPQAFSLLRTCEALRRWDDLLTAVDLLWPGLPVVRELEAALAARWLLDGARGNGNGRGRADGSGPGSGGGLGNGNGFGG